ncbi:hypothetical protein ACXYN8_11300 [Altererythrobacter sp. CAU 1778]
MSRLPPVVQTILAALAASAVATLWWMWADDIAPGRALHTPFPYLAALGAVVIGVPLWLFQYEKLSRSLLLCLLLATLTATPGIALAFSYFLFGRAVFASYLLLGTVWVGTSVFWVIARRIRY